MVEQKFRGMWALQKGACPKIKFIFNIRNTKLKQRWVRYQRSLQNQTIEEHYHGTNLTCDIAASKNLCNDKNCGVCGISRNGFDCQCVRKNIGFQRFGHGFYLAPNSSKCHDYTRGHCNYSAMLLCSVCPGNKYYLKRNNVTLTSPPVGFDSVYGQTGGNLNYDEIVLYNPDAILPRCIIVYKSLLFPKYIDGTSRYTGEIVRSASGTVLRFTINGTARSTSGTARSTSGMEWDSEVYQWNGVGQRDLPVEWQDIVKMFATKDT